LFFSNVKPFLSMSEKFLIPGPELLFRSASAGPFRRRQLSARQGIFAEVGVTPEQQLIKLQVIGN
jgi:hypothetical protein